RAVARRRDMPRRRSNDEGTGMTLDRTWLLATAREEREATGRTIQFTEPQQWELPSGCDDWRNRDVVAHLAASELVAAATLAGEPLSELQEYFDSLAASGVEPSVDGFNAFAVERRSSQSVRAVIGEWG